jgi:hypothetical protein
MHSVKGKYKCIQCLEFFDPEYLFWWESLYFCELRVRIPYKILVPYDIAGGVPQYFFPI